MKFGIMSKDLNKRIIFINSKTKAVLKNKLHLTEFIKTIFEKENTKLKSLQFIFCSDQELLSINKKFLNHNFFTDIITFNYSNKKKLIEGEVYISLDRVKENARTHKTLYTKELCRIMFHGVLHLCGYRDKTQKEISEMRSKEEYYLLKFEKMFVPRET